ncbi:hypothetical protein OH76DRAFT_1096209 [Lentinus brumalis]|uniref:Uncharacterized protein n=1 Tax=Lentinus brumalis TaxID=2498619 RepID=A0A371CW44_9APHY|nr:hypothetical protein OH76DRAFT_1096209 [Polyporus brumalis]
MGPALVPCHCRDCKGTAIPRGTRDKHGARMLREKRAGCDFARVQPATSSISPAGHVSGRNKIVKTHHKPAELAVYAESTSGGFEGHGGSDSPGAAVDLQATITWALNEAREDAPQDALHLADTTPVPWQPHLSAGAATTTLHIAGQHPYSSVLSFPLQATNTTATTAYPSLSPVRCDLPLSNSQPALDRLGIVSPSHSFPLPLVPELGESASSTVLTPETPETIDRSIPDLICDDDWEDADAEGEEEPLEDSMEVDFVPSGSPHGTTTAAHAAPPFLGQGHPPQQAKAQGDTPAEELDPFVAASSKKGHPSLLLSLSHHHPAVLLAFILCAWLHLAGHLPFRFCDVVLVVICQIFRELGHSALIPEMHTTLAAVLNTLRLDVPFQIFPCCPECRLVHPESVLADPKAVCSNCATPLFTFEGNWLRRSNPKRRLSFPFKSLTEQLQALLAVAGMEDHMDAWRHRSRILGRLADIFDGWVCRNLKGPDNSPFFRHDLPEGPDGELRIGVALGLDWCV